MTNRVENMEDIIRKIKKCLALANDGKSSDESDTAMLLAQKLMAKNNISMQDVEYQKENHTKNVVEGSGTEYTKLQWWMKSLANTIGENFRCYSFIRNWEGKTKIIFLGLETDVAICKVVYEYAVDSIKFFSDMYIKMRGVGGKRGTTIAIKNDYIAGYLLGLKDKFKQQIEKEGWGLVLVKDALVVRELEKLNISKGKPLKRKTNGDTEAREKGYNDGKNFSHT